MTFVNGQWHAVGPGDLLWNTTRQAILEKTDVFDSPLSKKNNGFESTIVSFRVHFFPDNFFQLICQSFPQSLQRHSVFL